MKTNKTNNQVTARSSRAVPVSLGGQQTQPTTTATVRDVTLTAPTFRLLDYRQAWDIVGGLSNPFKMPGSAYSLPTRACRLGAKLAKVPGTICSICYAGRGNYRFANVQESLERRLASLHHPLWCEAMATLIWSETHFRWHDSGELQGVWHLRNIAAVCRLTPHVQHWLPTREIDIVRAWKRAGGICPPNLCIRLSSTLIDGPAPEAAARELDCTVSGVSANNPTCPAPLFNNQCGPCRACWNRACHSITYQKH